MNSFIAPRTPRLKSLMLLNKNRLLWSTLWWRSTRARRTRRRPVHSLSCFRNLAAAGATVLIIHHTGKGDGTKEYRGSSDIVAAVDAAFVVERSAGANGI